MHAFRVWAPRAERVELVLTDSGDTHPMTPGAGNHYHCQVESAGPGTRYAFRLDGGDPRPDPCSAYQPEGIHGPSQVVDHSAFAWTDGRYRGLSLPGAVLYELHVGTFTPQGTFDAAIEKLPHLVELGVDAVELMPVAEFSGARGWGYDGVDLFAPHHAYGGPEGLKRLVNACHERGLGVVMDVVYNHLGPTGNYLAEFGPYFKSGEHTHWGDAVNFDGPESDEVRRFVIDNACMWLRDYHCDGLRLDAVHAIRDQSALHLLEELQGEVHALSAHLQRPLFLIAESDRNDPRLVRSRDAGGYGLAACWADEWHHALRTYLSGDRSGYYADFGSLELVAKALSQAWVYDGRWSEHRRRRHGRSPRELSGDRLVVFTQNHDQVGNRATGDRLGASVAEGRLRIAAALMLTSPFTPMLFQGEEWAASSPFQYFTDHHEPELGRAVSEGRTREFVHFGWDPAEVPDPQAPSTFERSKLDWSETLRAPHAAMLDYYRALLRLRRARPELTRPDFDSVSVRFDADAEWLVVERGAVWVVVNFAERTQRMQVPEGARALLASDADAQLDAGWAHLPGNSVMLMDSEG